MDLVHLDRSMMSIALRMAKRGLGRTAPNPAVGAVIADPATGEIIARGWTQPGGRPHAETVALQRAGLRARGAAMYVTLEPCAHHGQTPPCADAIIAAGIKRVIVGIRDPDPRTNGEGSARLTGAGVAVTAGVMAREARWVTLGHILRVTQSRPFVQLKIALGSGGEVPRGRDGSPSWVTGEMARAAGQRLRAEADAVLVGAGTVRDDDPALTCRLPGLADRTPLRVVLSRTLDMSASAQLFRTAREAGVLVLCGASADAATKASLAALGVEVVTVEEEEGVSGMRSALELLARRGVTRLLVEGGPDVWAQLSRAGLVDEIVVFHADASRDQIDETAVRRHLARWIQTDAVTLEDRRALGDDAVFTFRRAR